MGVRKDRLEVVDKKAINVISPDNGVGLTHSAAILSRALEEAGCEVSTHDIRAHPDSAWQPYTANVFMERLIPAWFEAAELNLMVPNQEWFLDEDLPHLPQVDCMLCKTRHAREIFDRLGVATEYTSFTSNDRLEEDQPRDPKGFFHLAGRSLRKGTETLLTLWERHPEWPPLTIVQHPETQLKVHGPNVKYISEYLEDDDLRDLQNRLGVHLCPSEVEGFGHSIVEPMTCRALVVTTDGPPMNEIVTPERGLLVEYRSEKPERLGMRYFVDSQALEGAIDEILGMDEMRQRRLGSNARDWYEENDRFFRQKVAEMIKNI